MPVFLVTLCRKNTMSETAENYDASKYDRPSVTVDIVILTLREKHLHVLLIERKAWPFEGAWAIPGGFVRMDESLEDAARRELCEETGVVDVPLEQLHTFGSVGRDPRTRVITVAYTALIPSEKIVLEASTDAVDARWYPVAKLPHHLAFDHGDILAHALRSLRRRLENSNVARYLLPDRFTLSQLQEVYEALLGKPVDKRNFRKWILSLGIVRPTDQIVRGHHRPALLYEFLPDDEVVCTDDSKFLWSSRSRRKDGGEGDGE